MSLGLEIILGSLGGLGLGVGLLAILGLGLDPLRLVTSVVRSLGFGLRR